MQIHSNYGVGDKELFPANRNLSEDYKDEKEALYYYTDDSVAMVFP